MSLFDKEFIDEIFYQEANEASKKLRKDSKEFINDVYTKSDRNKMSNKERNRVKKFLKDNDYDPKTGTIKTDIKDKSGKNVRVKFATRLSTDKNDKYAMNVTTGVNSEDRDPVGYMSTGYDQKTGEKLFDPTITIGKSTLKRKPVVSNGFLKHEEGHLAKQVQGKDFSKEERVARKLIESNPTSLHYHDTNPEEYAADLYGEKHNKYAKKYPGKSLNTLMSRDISIAKKNKVTLKSMLKNNEKFIEMMDGDDIVDIINETIETNESCISDMKDDDTVNAMKAQNQRLEELKKKLQGIKDEAKIKNGYSEALKKEASITLKDCIRIVDNGVKLRKQFVQKMINEYALDYDECVELVQEMYNDPDFLYDEIFSESDEIVYESKYVNEIESRKEAITKCISESEDLITALESIGAMYGIPASNILEDNSLDRINIVNDTIIAPNKKNVFANTQSIVCAVGAVLDYISQRINDKLEDYQSDKIDNCKLDEAKEKGDPSKGTVIGRYVSDEGDEIIVYDSGLVDKPNTLSAIKKVAELRKNGTIPPIKDGYPLSSNKVQYFSDSDDITNDVSDPTSVNVDNIPETDVATDIQESAITMDLFSKYNDTNHLGYDIFSEMGYDIQPVDSIITEAAVRKKKKKNLTSKDIKYMKFDNTDILKAVKYFNAARAEQSAELDPAKLDIKSMMSSPNWDKGIRSLENQFNCHISFKFVSSKEEGQNAGTFVHVGDDTLRYDVTISKSKGFQLGGMGIWITGINEGMWADAPSDPKLFGQSVVSVILHEVFHNVADAIRAKSETFLTKTSTAIALAQSARSAKAKRTIITKYVDSLSSEDIHFNNRLQKRTFIKMMMLVTSMDSDAVIRKTFDTTNPDNYKDEEFIDNLIQAYKDAITKANKTTKSLTSKTGPAIMTIIGIVISAIGVVTSLGSIVALGLFTAGVSGIGFLIKMSTSNEYEKLKNEYKSSKAFEEGYCDMFAGMYNFPIVFMLRDRKSNLISPIHVKDIEKLNELTRLEKELHTLAFTHYPTNSERNFAAAKIAENTLKNNKHLDPASKKYLEWVRDNFSNMLDTDIANEGQTTTFDPSKSEDLDKVIDEIITTGNVTVTESYNHV